MHLIIVWLWFPVQYKMDEVKKLAEKYLEPIPAQPEPPKVHTVEPPQTGERRIMVQKDVATPYLYIAYQVPEAKNEDYYAWFC